jgi:hypothetical protein
MQGDDLVQEHTLQRIGRPIELKNRVVDGRIVGRVAERGGLPGESTCSVVREKVNRRKQRSVSLLFSLDVYTRKETNRW